MPKPLIDADEIDEIFMDCMYHRGEADPDGPTPAEAKRAEGILADYGFHPVRLESHRARITEFLTCLPDEFQEAGGGGMSFVNACVDINDTQWGEHMNMERLFALGMALDLVISIFPRRLWSALPGGMPYYKVLGKVRAGQSQKDFDLAKPGPDVIS